MNKLDNKTKIWSVVILAIIVVGIGIIVTKGFNFDLRYKESQRIQLDLGKNFEISDIKNILDEIKPNEEILIQKVEVFEDSVAITANQITEEDMTSIISKVNEKYGTELKAEGVEIKTIPHTKLANIVTPYILPFIISIIIILVYMSIRYRRLELAKVLIKTLVAIIISQAIFISIIAITRIPVGKIAIFTDIVLYMITFITIMCKLEKEKEKVEDSKK